MSENLYYLFVSGVILGSGPCLVSCAPFLLFFTAAHKPGWKRSLCSYGVFSLGRLVAYALWGFVCILGATYLQSEAILRYANIIYLVLGVFIIVLGMATCLGVKDIFGKSCGVLTQGHVRNVGVAGFLIGLSPCLPLIGIVNYVALIARNPWDAPLYLFVFGLGTVFSPLVLLAAFSGKFAQVLSRSNKARIFLQYACGAMLIFLGARIIWGVVR